jgi:hypothetical protein
VKEVVQTALELANVLESGGNLSNMQTQEAIVANTAASSSSKTIDQVRVMEVNADNPAQIGEEEFIVIMEVYVQILVSARMMVRKTVNGVTTTEMTMSNQYITTKLMIE